MPCKPCRDKIKAATNLIAVYDHVSHGQGRAAGAWLEAKRFEDVRDCLGVACRCSWAGSDRDIFLGKVVALLHDAADHDGPYQDCEEGVCAEYEKLFCIGKKG